jgi:hypothetical protein
MNEKKRSFYFRAATRARQLMGLPAGTDLIDYCDWAILQREIWA